jgi:23S rRNA maturation-related 3'-5' exoribonuclease YhaM
MTDERYKLVERILDSIENEDLKELCIAILDDFPEYIWLVPGSSSGKYHPSTDLGEGGLMRHQIAVARFCNWKLELEQNQNKFDSRQRDCLRIACLCHDGRKSGEEDCGHTVHEHPRLMSEAVRTLVEKFPTHKIEINMIAHCIDSHMGQWCESKKSDLVLPKPQTEMEEFVHECDYLASRKDIELQFDDWKKPELPPLDTYVLTFGKYKDMKLVDAAAKDRGYIDWLKENYGREPVRSLLKLL